MTPAASSDAPRYAAGPLRDAARALFAAAGMQDDIAASVAASLLAADAMGHGTHGLALVPWYMDCIAAGQVTLEGDADVVADRGACVTWRGRRLPGAWLIDRALDLALDRVAAHGVVTVAIGDAFHTGALAAYLPRATGRGLMCVLACSAPAAASVAPHGGSRGVLTPNPLAAGIPTASDPILLDISASITTVNNARQLARTGGRFAGQWAIDADGRASDDPAVLLSGGGTLLPVGGIDHGHKGYAMALLVDALTQALPGHGRADRPKGVAMGVFLQLLDPAAFGGLDAYTRQSTFVADACRSNPPRPGSPAVRVPGDRAAALSREATERGVPVLPETAAGIAPHAKRLGVAWPEPLAA